MIDRKHYASLDVAKFIAAILIIVLHANPFSSYSGILAYGFRNIITVIAVPFFFATSGFLFFAKLNSLSPEDKKQYFSKYFKRLALMYLLWSTVYFVFVVIDWIKNGFEAIDLLIYIRDFFFEGSYSTIWFLPALMTAVTLVYFLKKKLSYTQIFLIAIPFYLLACLGSSYYGLTQRIPLLNEFFNIYFCVFDSIKNGLLFGFVYVALGGILSEKSIATKPWKAFLLMAIFFVLMAAETVVQYILGWSTNGVDTKIMLLPLTLMIIVFVLSLNFPQKSVFVLMRTISLLMFLSQRIFLTLFDWFLYNTVFVNNSILYFASILLLTLLFSIVFIKLSERIKLLKSFY